MPNPRTGTVTPDVETAVKNAKAGQIQFRTDRAGIVHGCVGRIGFESTQIRENVAALITDLRKLKPASAKGVYIQRVTLSTTMGGGVPGDRGDPLAPPIEQLNCHGRGRRSVGWNSRRVESDPGLNGIGPTAVRGKTTL